MITLALDIAVDLSGQGFVLAATVLSWPNLVCQIDDRAQATLYYPANRIGSNATSRRAADLAEIIGAARRPSSSVSTHRVLPPNRRRVGRRVLYRRTERADALMEVT